jgi:hypothetical protein
MPGSSSTRSTFGAGSNFDSEPDPEADCEPVDGSERAVDPECTFDFDFVGVPDRAGGFLRAML